MAVAATTGAAGLNVFGGAPPLTAAIRTATATATATDTETGPNGLSLEAGWAGAFDPTAPIPVRVTITADRLIRGTLVVEADGFVPNSLPIEVAGGSRKRILMVLPGSDLTSSVTITAKVEGDARLSARIKIESRALA